jgi:uncharacterized alkaline shock family protein YloU
MTEAMTKTGLEDQGAGSGEATTGPGLPQRTTTRPVNRSISVTDRGRTSIADTVVAKIAAMAAREIPGVYQLGAGGVARAFGAMRERVPGGRANVAHGVSVEVGEKQTAIDMNVITEYGVSITELASAIRENVIGALERMTGLEVVEVNISVDDVHLPEEEKPQLEPRVQ